MKHTKYIKNCCVYCKHRQKRCDNNEQSYARCIRRNIPCERNIKKNDSIWYEKYITILKEYNDLKTDIKYKELENEIELLKFEIDEYRKINNKLTKKLLKYKNKHQ